MIQTKETVYRKDLEKKKIFVTRDFDAPIQRVWEAWTRPEILDQWWAPKPWKAVTTQMDFRSGGQWLHYMEGPDGTRHYCRADYNSVVAGKSYEGKDSFCDEDGNPIDTAPSMHWNAMFSETGNGTRVDVELSFASVEDLEKIVEMGFQEGFAAAHANLDEIFG